MDKILILGGGGFLGKELSKKIIKKNRVSIFQRKKPKFLDRKIKFKKVDLLDYHKTIKEIKNFDYVINCAAVLNGQSQKKLFVDNFKIFFFSYIACLKNGIKNYMFISSNNVCSKSNFIKLKNNKILITDGYTLAKIFSEYVGKKLSNNFKILFKIIRPSNLYGHNQKNGAIYYILTQIMISKSNKLLLKLNKNTKRNFSHVEDCANCIVKLLKINKDLICNITNNKKVSLGQISKICLKVLNKNLNIEFNSSTKKDIKLFKSFNLNKYIVWKDKYDLYSGIKKMKKKYKKQLILIILYYYIILFIISYLCLEIFCFRESLDLIKFKFPIFSKKLVSKYFHLL